MPRRSFRGPLAQSVEHRTFNPLVVGSIPTRPTNPSVQSVSESDSIRWSLVRFQHGPPILPCSRSRNRTQSAGRWFDSNTARQLVSRSRSRNRTQSAGRWFDSNTARQLVSRSRSRNRTQPAGRGFDSNTAHQSFRAVGLGIGLNPLVEGSIPARPQIFPRSRSSPANAIGAAANPARAALPWSCAIRASCPCQGPALVEALTPAASAASRRIFRGSADAG